MWYIRRLRWWLQDRFHRFKSSFKRWWSKVGAGALLYKYLGVGKVIGLGKIAKMAWMLGSMLLFVWTFAVSQGWPFALGLGLLLFLHEMGHALAAAMVGMEVSLPIFIPFMGAFISMRRNPKNAVEEAVVGAGGPVLGTLATLACLVLYQLRGNPLYLGLAYIGAFMHLFNLIPVAPLDGGRMVAPLSRWVWYPTLPLALFAGLYFGNFLLLLVVWFGLAELRRTRGPEAAVYFRATGWQRLWAALVYFGLLGLNLWIFWMVLRLQEFADVDLSEGQMSWPAALILTVVLTAGYVGYQIWQRRREAERQAAMLAAMPVVDPRLVRLRALRIYRRLGSGYGRRWRMVYRGPRSGWRA